MEWAAEFSAVFGESNTGVLRLFRDGRAEAQGSNTRLPERRQSGWLREDNTERALLFNLATRVRVFRPVGLTPNNTASQELRELGAHG